MSNPTPISVQIEKVWQIENESFVYVTLSPESERLLREDVLITTYCLPNSTVRVSGEIKTIENGRYGVHAADLNSLRVALENHRVKYLPVVVVNRMNRPAAPTADAPQRVVLNAAVYPSTEPSIVSIVTDEKYNGAHNYEIKPMLRYESGKGYQFDLNAIRNLLDANGVYITDKDFVEAFELKTSLAGTKLAEVVRLAEAKGLIKPNPGGAVYGLEGMPITFVKKNEDGTWQPGVQSEQLLLLLLDRHAKLNAEFPTPGLTHHKFMAGIQIALDALKERVDERTTRGVMGELKK